MQSPRPSQAFISAVRAGLNECGWESTRPLVVAFSGGADSTALLLACAAIVAGSGVPVHAAHFDHRIRDDSARDREYIDHIADQLGTPVITGVGDVPAFARERSMSLETAARELRYRFLSDAVEKVGAQGVVTGHTMDDQAETVLMNALRGSGTRGLSGMRRRTTRPAGRDWPAVAVLRPMLGLRHSDCETACRDAGVRWLEDPSNRDTTFMRNRVRHELLPLVEQIRQGAVPALARLADNVREADRCLRDIATAESGLAVEGQWASVSRGRLRLLQAALQTQTLAAMYEAATGGIEGLEHDHLIAMRELASGGSGTELSLPAGFVFRVDYDRCSISPAGFETATWLPSSVPNLALPIPGEVELPGGFTIKASRVELTRTRIPEKFDNSFVYVSAEAVRGPLRVRARAPGDRFHPLGMESEVRLQDFFVNAHVPERLRDRIPLLESDRGIAWVVDCRIAEWAKLVERDKQAVRLELAEDQ